MKKSLALALFLFAAAGMTLSASDAFKAANKAADEAAKTKNWQQVVSIYEGAIKDFDVPKEQISALVKMADAYAKMGKLDETVGKLLLIPSISGATDADSFRAISRIAGIRIQQKRDADALKVYEGYLPEVKDARIKCQAQFEIANLQAKLKMNDELTASLKTVSEMIPGLPANEQADAWLRIGGLYGKAKAAADAQQALKKAMEIGKGTAVATDAAVKLADSYVNQKKFAEAESLYQQAIAELEKAAAEKQAKDAEKAAAAAAKGKAVKPSAAKGGSGRLIDVKVKLGKTYLMQKKINEGTAAFDSALAIPNITDKQKISVTNDKINAYVKAGMYPMANTAVEGILPMLSDPDEKIRMYNHQAEILYLMKDYQAALNVLNQAEAVQGAKKAKASEPLKKKINKAMTPAPEKPAAKPAGKPAAAPAGKPEGKPAAAPAGKPEAKPAAAPAGKPEAKPATEPAGKPEAKPAAEPAGKPEAKPAAEPAPAK